MAKKTQKKNLSKIAVKQRLVLDKLSENISNPNKSNSMKQAMMDAGYSESYAETNLIAKTKTWEEILEEKFPDNYVAEKHDELMNLKRVGRLYFPKKVPNEKIREAILDFGFKCSYIALKYDQKVAYFAILNENARKAALDMIYKIKKKYDTTITIKGKIGELSDDEIEERIAREVSSALGAIAGEGEKDQQ